MTIAETVYEKLKAAPPEIAKEVLDFLEFLEAKAGANPGIRPKSFDQFYGILKESRAFDGDPVEIQRNMRAEWDRELDK